VPFSGDYTEGMDERQVPKYDYWLQRRNHWAAEEAENIEALIKAQTER